MVKINSNPLSYLDNSFSPLQQVTRSRGLQQDVFEKKERKEIAIPEGYTKEEAYSAFLNYLLLRMIDDKINVINKKVPIEKIFGDLQSSEFGTYASNRLIKNGIKTSGDLRRFLNLVSKTGEHNRKNINNYIEIYGQLENKDDIKNFPDVLLISEIVRENTNDLVDINFYTNFIKKTGVDTEKKFFKNFGFIEPEEKEEIIIGKFEFLEDIRKTYDYKFDSFKEAIDPNSEMKDKDLRKIYLSNRKIIDFLYERAYNWEDIFSNIYKLSSEQNRLSQETKEEAKKNTYGDLDKTKNRVLFFMYLKDKDITIPEINNLAKRGVVFDVSFEDIIQNRDDILENLTACGMKRADAINFYSKYKEILNSCFENDDYFSSNNGIKSAVEVIKLFEIKDDKDFQSLYCTLFKKPNKYEINKKDVLQTIDILSFADKNHVLKYKKNKNCKILDELASTKGDFEQISDEYKNFVSPEGVCAFDIYKKTKDIKATENAVQNLIYDVSPREEKIFKELLNYLDSPYEAKEFINNNINLSGINDYEKYASDCLKIVKVLSALENEDYFEKLKQDGTIKKSKQYIGKIVDKYNTDEKLSLFFRTLFDRKIDSAQELYNFLEQYQDKDKNTVNVLEHFADAPFDMSIEKYRSTTEKIEDAFNIRHIPIKIDNENIKNLNYSLFIDTDKKIKDKTIGHIADKLSLHKNGGNFVTDCKQAFAKKDFKINRWEAANEIKRYIDDYRESYKNLIRVLGFENYKELSGEQLARRIPNNLLQVINSKDWTTFDNKPLNLSIHARLRLIERYILDENSTIEDLTKKETINKLKSIINTVYGTTPICVKNEIDNAFSCIYNDSNSPIERTKAIFKKDGKLVTVVPADD